MEEFIELTTNDILHDNAPLPAWKVMIVDDDEDVHHVTKVTLSDFVFDQRPVEFISAYSGREAITLMAEHDDIALLLLDVVMETDDAGMKVVNYVRQQLDNQLIRIVLRTGQPGHAPEEKVIIEYDINDYKEKTELSDIRLKTTLISAFRAYRSLVDLSSAKQQAVTANKAKNTFLDNMNHELYTPLNGVLGYCELLMEESSEQALQEINDISHKIHQAGKNLLYVLHSVMDVVQIESNTIETTYQSIIIPNLITRVMSRVQPVIEKNQNQLQLTIAEAEAEMMSTINCDEQKIDQILYHLLGNAAKFTNQGIIKLNVSLKLIDAQNYLIFQVIDTGIGISQPYFESIFNAFYQIDQSNTRTFGGNGLGLFIVKHFTQHLGGYLEFDSQLDQGSTFTVSIPIKNSK